MAIFSEEQEALRRMVRDFLADRSPESEVRRLMATPAGLDRDVWATLCGQLGLIGVRIPEKYGGAGLTIVELGVVLEEMGRVLLCVPYFATAMLGAGTLLAASYPAAASDYLPGIASGDIIATLAMTEGTEYWSYERVGTRAARSASGWRLDDIKTHVLDGHIADLLLITARTDVGVSIFAVDGDAPGMSRVLLETLDQTRKQAGVEMAGTPARLIGRDGAGSAIVRDVATRAAVVLAMEQVGGAAQALEMAVAYAKVRYQFGRPIGAFQAVKHKCADMLVAVESARSAAYHATFATGEHEPDAEIVASIAKAYCSEAYVQVAKENILVHGGIGFTWEHPAHLYFRRAKTGSRGILRLRSHRSHASKSSLPAIVAHAPSPYRGACPT